MTQKMIVFVLFGMLLAACSDYLPSSQSIQNSLSQKNFGQAMEQADKLAKQNDIRAQDWVIIAEARSANQQKLSALAALESALKLGWKDSQLLENSPYLKLVRESPEYDRLLQQFNIKSAPSSIAGENIPKTDSHEETSAQIDANGDVEAKAGSVSVKISN